MNQSTTTLIEALPACAYTDAGLFGIEQDAIFARSWQFVGHVEKLHEPGDYFVLEVAGESLLVVRENSDTVNAFYNVCAHRGVRLLDGEGCKPRFSCPYHGWTYDCQGRLVATPNAQNVSGFDKSAYRLRACRVELYHGLVFVNLDDEAPPLAVDRTHLTVDWYFPSTELADWERRLLEHHAATTFAEDQAIMASVQRSLGSRGFDSGPLMIDAAGSQYSEHAVAAIQQLWRDAMGEKFEH